MYKTNANKNQKERKEKIVKVIQEKIPMSQIQIVDVWFGLMREPHELKIADFNETF